MRPTSAKVKYRPLVTCRLKSRSSGQTRMRMTVVRQPVDPFTPGSTEQQKQKTKPEIHRYTDGVSAGPDRPVIRQRLARRPCTTRKRQRTRLPPMAIPRPSWQEFPSGLPLLEALNVGNVDLSADVADTVPIFSQDAQAKLT